MLCLTLPASTPGTHHVHLNSPWIDETDRHLFATTSHVIQSWQSLSSASPKSSPEVKVRLFAVKAAPAKFSLAMDEGSRTAMPQIGPSQNCCLVG